MPIELRFTTAAEARQHEITKIREKLRAHENTCNWIHIGLLALAFLDVLNIEPFDKKAPELIVLMLIAILYNYVRDKQLRRRLDDVIRNP